MGVTLSAVVFAIGDDRYAVPAHAVREVMVRPRTTALPIASAVLVGAFNLRGDVVPMFDAAALLGIGTLVEGPFALVVISSAGLAGLITSGLPTVVELGDRIAPSELRGTLGVYGACEEVVVLLDVDALVTHHPATEGAMNAGQLVGR